MASSAISTRRMSPQTMRGVAHGPLVGGEAVRETGLTLVHAPPGEALAEFGEQRLARREQPLGAVLRRPAHAGGVAEFEPARLLVVELGDRARGLSPERLVLGRAHVGEPFQLLGGARDGAEIGRRRTQRADQRVVAGREDREQPARLRQVRVDAAQQGPRVGAPAFLEQPLPRRLREHGEDDAREVRLAVERDQRAALGVVRVLGLKDGARPRADQRRGQIHPVPRRRCRRSIR